MHIQYLIQLLDLGDVNKASVSENFRQADAFHCFTNKYNKSKWQSLTDVTQNVRVAAQRSEL